MPEVDDPPAVKEIASALPKQDAPVTTAKQNSVETQRSIKQPPRLQILNGKDAGVTLALDKAIVKNSLAVIAASGTLCSSDQAKPVARTDISGDER